MKCVSCGADKFDPILNMGEQPLANGLRRDDLQPVQKYPLAIQRCQACSLVQLTHHVDPEILFRNYVWVTGTSPSTQEYSREFCQRIRGMTPKRLFVVEVASNDGTFLRQFQEAGDAVLGIDPARNIAEDASRRGIPTWAVFFNRQTARKVRDLYCPANIVIARNVLPHVQDPLKILHGMADCMQSDGVAVVEFHQAKAIQDELHYDSIYHEHVSYFSLGTMTALMKRAKLYPFDLFPSPISGGSWVVCCSKYQRDPSLRLRATLDEERFCGVDDLGRWQEFAVDDLGRWQEFASRSALHAEQLKDLVGCFSKVIGWGASARGSTLVHFAGIDNLAAIADNSSLKQGLFSPTGIRICPPKEALALNPAGVLLLAWNFKDEIMAELKRLGYRGKVIVPLPDEPHLEDVT